MVSRYIDIPPCAVLGDETHYLTNNSYVLDACAQYPERLLAAGSVDVPQRDAPEVVGQWVAQGLGRILGTARTALAVWSSEDHIRFFARTAQSPYPALAN